MEYEKFDVKRALAGEPVILRNGKKAYVRHHETELEVDYGSLLGFIENASEVSFCRWDFSGLRYYSKGEYPSDIIGMWSKEPLTMPDSFWDMLTSEIVAIAKDGDGDWCGYRNKPHFYERHSNWGVDYLSSRNLRTFNPDIFPDCKPEDSLILRPAKYG